MILLLGPTQASVSRIFNDVVVALANKAVQGVKMPATEQHRRATAQDFARIRGFPRVIGTIDCTHIAIKAPSIDEHLYVNRKRYHSLNVQVVCNARGLITSFCARFPGDGGYPLMPFLMVPYKQPETLSEHRFNKGHTSTRVVVEQAFGVLKLRFRQWKVKIPKQDKASWRIRGRDGRAARWLAWDEKLKRETEEKATYETKGWRR
ncbi:putative nuclease HARBI1 [Chionoecetes opilio]|uniref:Putative nuclease HARBI1 n=1 Tax=Chionoecetes opilio TaxID=41210 RepID=A0A8J4XZK1_CHIOP|nr:putative nuclease HARBI1 [Chionoecetes opilio]